MSIKAIFETMAELVQQHQELNGLSAKKTKLIKDNNTRELSSLLKKERKYLMEISMTEKNMMAAVTSYLEKKKTSAEDATVSVLLDYMPVQYHEPLLKMQEGLLREIDLLREKEMLNRTLVEDSLHFIHLTLDMVQPDPEAVHYQHPSEKQPGSQQGFSIFDSKA